MTARIPNINDLRVKLCFICREEEQFDDQSITPKAWTHPCKCTLIAHESCLLTWIQAAQSKSQNTFFLRFLTAGNVVLQKVGKVFTGFIAVSMVGAVGAGVYIILAGYGAWALSRFIGKEMFDALLTDDPSNWSWASYVNLPLIPISLILSRLQSSSQMPPIIPILLVWPPLVPVRARNSVLEEYLSRPPSTPSSLVSSLFPWPPSPVTFGLFALPIVRTVYRICYRKLYLWVLGTSPPTPRPSSQLGLNINEGAFMIRIRANVNEPGVPEQPPQAEPEPIEPEIPIDQDPNAAAVAAAEQLVDSKSLSLGRRIGGALAIPAISSFMGSLLFRISRSSSLLRNFLGIRNHLAQYVSPSSSSSISPKYFQESGSLKQISLMFRLGLGIFWGGSKTWAEADPVWWRNSVGLGLFVAAKDCIHLFHLWLIKRELQSRRIKSKDFAGVSLLDLDLIPSFPRPTA